MKLIGATSYRRSYCSRVESRPASIIFLDLFLQFTARRELAARAANDVAYRSRRCGGIRAVTLYERYSFAFFSKIHPTQTHNSKTLPVTVAEFIVLVRCFARARANALYVCCTHWKAIKIYVATFQPRYGPGQPYGRSRTTCNPITPDSEP